MKRWMLGLLLLACGPRKPEMVPGKTMFWRVTSSSVAFGACSDDPEFRQGIQPIRFEPNTYLVYKIDPDGRKARLQSCQSFDPSSCVDHSSGLVFDVAGTQLLLSRESKSPIGNQGCQLHVAQTWTLSDEGETLNTEVVDVLSLVDNRAACDSLEAQVKADSPNGQGLQGCVITFKIGASIR